MSAYQKQMEVLLESEGADCKLLRDLKTELGEVCVLTELSILLDYLVYFLVQVKRVDTDKADKEARQFVF